jgi:hypothetical protein
LEKEKENFLKKIKGVTKNKWEKYFKIKIEKKKNFIT